MTITTTPGSDKITFASSGGGGGALTIQDEGTSLSTAGTTLNFTGAGVTASGTSSTKTIDITPLSMTSLNGGVVLDSKTITTNTQNIDLDIGANHTAYEYFSIKCIDVLGTENGYIVWQPINTSGSLHNTSTNSKWKSTNLTDDTENSLTHETKNYHIFGFHTLGKQYIESNIFGINKSDKKYSTFKTIGLHSTGSETNSQEGSTSQISTTECKQIRLNNYSISGTLGNISSGTFILYGYKKTSISSSSLVPVPTTADKGKIITVNAAGDDLQYGANFRELACNQTIIQDYISITNANNIPLSIG